MYDYISGRVTELNPTYVVIDNQGIGYYCNITVNTYSALGKVEAAKLFIKEIIREDVHDLYAFLSKEERSLFIMLISVSGVGANTARVILSSLTEKELEVAIASGDVDTLKGVKGIGLKSAQRIIVELKDKISSVSTGEQGEIFASPDNRTNEEALSALTMLGFNKAQVQKALKKLLSAPNSYTVESLIKDALKIL
jgi:Holliday junction DNA helicase RuvA